MKRSYVLIIGLVFVVFISSSAFADFEIDGTYEAAIELPRIWFLLKRAPDGPALEIGILGEFWEQYAFLDTGASGMLLSRETAVEYMELNLEPEAVYADVGVGGSEYFDISEELYVGILDFNSPLSSNPDAYSVTGPYRFQVKKEFVEEFSLGSPIDILGVPIMAGKTVVLDSGNTNNVGYFNADIKDFNDPCIPPVDFELPLVFEKFVFPEDPINIPPYPALAYNPLIPNVTIDHNGVSSTGDYLLDTGAMLSMISVEQGVRLGLTDPNGDPIVSPAFAAEVGGVGGTVIIFGYKVNRLRIATNKGYDLVYKNAMVGVLDISVYDAVNDEIITLDGIFGSNFLCATMDSDLSSGFDIKMSGTPFDWVVIDMNDGFIGFDVNDSFPVPKDSYNITDLKNLSDHWLLTDCNYTNSYCEFADFNMDGAVNMGDYAVISQWWHRSRSANTCGSTNKPYINADFNRDCIIGNRSRVFW